MNNNHVERCQQRLPTIVIGKYEASLLCDKPKDHDGPCAPDDYELEVPGIALPEIEKSVLIEETRKAMIDHARAVEKRTLEAVYGQQE